MLKGLTSGAFHHMLKGTLNKHQRKAVLVEKAAWYEQFRPFPSISLHFLFPSRHIGMKSQGPCFWYFEGGIRLSMVPMSTFASLRHDRHGPAYK